MKTYIALFRGINVGGKGILPMRELVAILERLGSSSVKTYIQSGNAVFRHRAASIARLAKDIRGGVKKRCGFEPHVFLLEMKAMETAIASNPFPKAESDPKTLHLFFLDAAPKNPDLKMLETVKSKKEQFHLEKNIFYLHAPDGIGRSKLAARAEKSLGVAATARNWRTVCKIMDMAKECR
jgi:uncharacterized protein (DUF1697 family)